MPSDQSQTTAELVSLLHEFYTEAEAFRWLTSPQPLHGEIPLDMIAGGRVGELIISLRRMSEGVYL